MRAHGADLCYSPMIHAQIFVSDSTYRKTSFSTWQGELDNPFIIQVCFNYEICMYQNHREYGYDFSFVPMIQQLF